MSEGLSIVVLICENTVANDITLENTLVDYVPHPEAPLPRIGDTVTYADISNDEWRDSATPMISYAGVVEKVTHQYIWRNEPNHIRDYRIVVWARSVE